MNRRRRARELEKVNLLEMVPIRLAAWSERGGRVVIERPKPQGASKLSEKLRYWLAVRRIRLDDRGSAVWRLLDGTTTVAQIAEALREEYGAEVEPAEDRAGRLIRMLHREDLVAYPGWDEIGDSREC